MKRPIFKAMILFSLSLVVFLSTKVYSQGQSKFYDKSYALVVGINKYPNLKLKTLNYAKNDAQGMAKYLKQQGFMRITLYDEQATKKNIVSKLQLLARVVKEDDRVLFFFAGHGYTETYNEKDYGYIIPYDGGDDSATFLSMAELRELSEKMGKAKHQLFIMDACYGGLLATKHVAPIKQTIPNYLGEITKRDARQIITAGGKDQEVLDGGLGGHSVFTGYLLEALQKGFADTDGDGYITAMELCSYLTPKASNEYQTPACAEFPGHGKVSSG